MDNGNKNRQFVTKISQSDKPLVSIITVCLNSEKYLEQTIQSVINQTYDNIEYIIIDGGSNDRTLDIIKKYENRIAYWVSEPDKGIYDAMNKGISFARGEWVGIINSDDWYAPDTVHCIVEAAAEKPETGVFFGNMIVYQPENNRVAYHQAKKGQPEDLSLEMNIPHPTCFVARRIYEQFQFNPAFRIAGDYDLLVRFYFNGIKFSHIDRTLVYYRPGGISTQNFYRRIIEEYRIHSRYHCLKALQKWFHETNNFFLGKLRKCFPEAFKNKYRNYKKKIRAFKGHRP